MKQPEDHIICPRCQRPYSFIRARFTTNKGENMCINCGQKELEKNVKKDDT